MKTFLPTIACFAILTLTQACTHPNGQDTASNPSTMQTPRISRSFSHMAFEGTGVIPFTLGGPWIIVDGVNVNDRGPFRFMFDTGGSGGGRVDVTLAEKLGLVKVDEVQAGDGSGRPGPLLPVYELESLSFGPLNFKGVRVLSRDYNPPAAVAARGGPIDGILGMQLFEQLLLTIDYPNSELRISRDGLPAPNGRDIFGYEKNTPIPQVEVGLDGSMFAAQLDTGAQGGVLIGGKEAEGLPWKGERRTIGQARTVSGPFEIQAGTLDGDLVIGGVRVANPELMIAPPFNGVILGAQFLNRFVISIDQYNGRVRLVDGETAPAAQSGQRGTRRVADGNPPKRRYGIGMAPPRGGEEYITVLMVTAGNVAAEAGVQVNDKITHVNGTLVSELSAIAFGAAMRGSPLTLVVDRDGKMLTFKLSLSDETPMPAPSPSQASPEQTAAYKDAALQLAELLQRRYLFPDIGIAYAGMLRANANADRYATASGPGAFASQLTADLAAVSYDAHLAVLARSNGPPGLSPSGSDPTTLGIRDSGWLKDKVAFMRITMMPDTTAAQNWSDAFMREHADAEALILDLRMCPGGTLAMMNGFLPYLYDKATHLLTMDMRPGADEETEALFDAIPELRRIVTDGAVHRWEHWIEPNGAAKPDMPVYVLTDITASACEHLTAALKATDRATVIGATTRGAGHFVAFHNFGEDFSVVLPIGRTFDPKTGEGWEGDGIAPHIVVDPADAQAEVLRLITKDHDRPH